MGGINFGGIEIKLPKFSPNTQQQSSENTTSGLQGIKYQCQAIIDQIN
jgi:hypothetical protein